MFLFYREFLEVWVSGLNQFPAKEPDLIGLASSNLAASAELYSICSGFDAHPRRAL